MKTKNGEPIPQDLANALEAAPDMLIAWDKLRPSCQRDYVDLVMKAEDPQMREHAIQKVLKMTGDYYRRHPKKYESRQD